ncbi:MULTISPECIES: phage head morphogenesis protein [unclassified Xanthobacter]|uniref:phage head morphogenesis protein n=1 Tax=unclassified Xanthobacter TaxID=2623496 RepID=UPI001EDCE1ED|nr:MULTISPECIES: phage head morphogenesis protein [unclassified Xanthobacter]
MDDKERARRFRRERREQLRRSVLIQTDTVREVLVWLEQARTGILAALAGTPSSFESWRLGHLSVEVRRTMDLFERGATDVLTRGLDRAWLAGSDLVVQPLAAGGIDLSGQLPALDARLLIAMRSFQADRIRDISTTAVNRINQEIGQAALGLRSPFEAARQVGELLDTSAGRARRIVRDELGTVYSEAGQQRMEQAKAAGVAGLQKQWRRSGKLHARITHDLADGQIVDVDQPFMVGGLEIPKPRDPSIPLGERINCGCASLPYMRHWRVSTPGPRPYSAQELATSPAARQVEEVRAATPIASQALLPGRSRAS